MKVKKANYQHSLDRAAVLNPDEDIDVHDSKLSKSVLDLDKKIQRLEKKQKAIGDSLKAIQSEVRWSNWSKYFIMQKKPRVNPAFAPWN